MKPIAVILTSVVLSAGAAALTVKLMEPAKAADSPPPTEQLRERMQLQENELAKLKKEIADARTQQSAQAAPAASRVSSEELELAIAQWMAKHAGSTGDAVAGPASQGAGSGAGKKGDRASQVSTFFASIREATDSYEKRHQLWSDAAKAGVIDDVLAAFEQFAKENAGSADAQTELAHAYFEKLQTVPDGPEKGKWATMGDKTLDKALELNPQHWEARFTKAMGLSFWPAIFGKQNEAIENFEILRKQQESSGGSKEGFAQTYQFLGNLYQQQGKMDKAMEVFQKGASLFPNNTGLQQAVKTAAAGK